MSTIPPTSTVAPNSTVRRQALTRRLSVGTFLGFVWSASLRAWMVLLALELGDHPYFTFVGTFGAVLFPTALVGGCWAQLPMMLRRHRRHDGAGQFCRRSS